MAQEPHVAGAVCDVVEVVRRARGEGVGLIMIGGAMMQVPQTSSRANAGVAFMVQHVSGY